MRSGVGVLLCWTWWYTKVARWRVKVRNLTALTALLLVSRCIERSNIKAVQVAIGVVIQDMTRLPAIIPTNDITVS